MSSRAIGPASALAVRTASRTRSRARETTTEPVVAETMSIACSMGTPAPSMEDRLRVVRAR